MTKLTKKYWVRYSFIGGGTLVVESTSKGEAQKKAVELLKVIVPILRPATAQKYSDKNI